MKLEHSFTVPVGIDDAWRILLDIERIGPCMPGATIESVDGDDFTGSVKVKLGAINLTYKGKASFVEKDETAHRAVIDARGRDARGSGTAAAKVTAVLTEDGGSTAVVVDTDLDITGKVAQFGRGVMVDVGNKLIGQFADCLAATITAGDGDTARDTAAEPAGDEEPRRRPSPSRPAAATAGAADAGTQSASATAPEDATAAIPATKVVDEEALAAVAATPTYSAPTDQASADEATATTVEPSVNGAAPTRSAAAAPAPRPEAEPINLLEHAGPAVAKRLAPVLAVLAVLVAVIAWRRRRG